MRGLNIANQQFGRLTVISPTNKRSGGKIVWLCRCSCGNFAEVNSGNLRLAFTKSCGCLRKEGHSWVRYGDISGNYWHSVRQSAARRGLKFSIRIQEAWRLFLQQNKKCFFTGRAITLTRDGRNQTASMDRKNPNKGYIRGNIQWVHKRINIARMDLTVEEFISVCHEIAARFPDAQTHIETLPDRRRFSLRRTSN